MPINRANTKPAKLLTANDKGAQNITYLSLYD